ncbi:MAG: CHAD domain-containing protein [Planctomycetota bacterium]
MEHSLWRRETGWLRPVPRRPQAAVRTLRSHAALIDPGGAIVGLREAVPTAIDGCDPEGVHTLRVQTRRLIVFLQLAGRRALIDDLRWVRSAAAEVRDLDVLIQRTLPDEIRVWFAQQRDAAQAHLRHALECSRTQGLLEALEWLEPVSIDCAQGELVRLRRLVARRGEDLAQVDDDPHRERLRLHDLRRALRRLRYTLAWVGNDPPRLRRLQNALGGMNDVEQFAIRLLEYPERARVIELITDVEARAAAAQAACMTAWEDARDEIEALAFDS